ncbi:MAG: hypothetical protein H0U10_15500 [Chloroflexia bacterium]|nr:hypothetical protein [Chloroflexia bacterium]
MGAPLTNRTTRRTVATLGVLTAALSLAIPAAVAAAQAMPAAPSPAVLACDGEALSAETFARVVTGPPGAALSTMRGTPAATPPPPTGGVPAGPEVAAAVTETFDRFAACLNAGDQLRAFALFSEEFLGQTYGGIAGSDLSLEAAVREIDQAPPPTPLPAELQVPTPTVEDVRVLPDGRVTATIRSTFGQSVAVFIERDGRYLIDGAYELPEAATPTP